MNLIITNTIGELTHINTRKEMHGDDSVFACDLDNRITVPAEETLKQLCVGDHDRLLNAFWTKDGKSSEPTISSIKMSHKLKDHQLERNVEIERPAFARQIKRRSIILKPNAFGIHGSPKLTPLRVLPACGCG